MPTGRTLRSRSLTNGDADPTARRRSREPGSGAPVSSVTGKSRSRGLELRAVPWLAGNNASSAAAFGGSAEPMHFACYRRGCALCSERFPASGMCSAADAGRATPAPRPAPSEPSTDGASGSVCWALWSATAPRLVQTGGFWPNSAQRCTRSSTTRDRVSLGILTWLAVAPGVPSGRMAVANERDGRGTDRFHPDEVITPAVNRSLSGVRILSGGAARSAGVGGSSSYRPLGPRPGPGDRLKESGE